jgi:hypothetical protein
LDNNGMMKHCVDLKVCDSNTLAWRVNLLFNGPERLEVMPENAGSSTACSACRVLDYVLGWVSAVPNP